MWFDVGQGNVVQIGHDDVEIEEFEEKSTQERDQRSGHPQEEDCDVRVEKLDHEQGEQQNGAIVALGEEPTNFAYTARLLENILVH